MLIHNGNRTIFECAAAKSAMSMSDSAKNISANEDWKEQYKSRNVHPKCVLRRCRFLHHQIWAKFQQNVKNIVEQWGTVIIQQEGYQCITLKIFRDGVVSEELAMNLRDTARRDYPEGSMSKYMEHSMYVPIRDAMLLQLQSSNTAAKMTWFWAQN